MAVPDDWKHAKRVSFCDIRRALDGASLRERNAVLGFIQENIARIRPTVDDDWLYDAMSSYFLECMAVQSTSNVADENASIHSPFEAARELVEWFNWYVKRVEVPTEIGRIVDRITVAFKNGDHLVRNCIETGFLEHVLEIPDYRPHFSHWERDAILADSYTEALRWGVAHTRSDAP